jgi:hypothetical protein
MENTVDEHDKMRRKIANALETEFFKDRSRKGSKGSMEVDDLINSLEEHK